MKKLTVLLTLFLTANIAGDLFAQKFSVQGGLTISSVQSKDNDENYSYEYTNRPGFHVGLILTTPINHNLSFQTGTILTTKGYKIELDLMGTEINYNMNPLYLDIPLLLKIGQNGNISRSIFGAIGVYYGIGLAGDIKITTSERTVLDEDISWGKNQDDNLRRIDYGLIIGAGIETSRVIISASYDLGLANIAVSHDNGTVLRNRALKFTAGFKF